MRITEPVTMLTDFALAAASLCFAFLLTRILGPRNRVSAWLWCAAFIASSIAALIGGIYHGFTLYFDASTLRFMWNAVIYTIGLTTGLIIGGIHAAYIQREEGAVKWFMSGALLTIIGLIVQRSGFRSHLDFNHNDFYHLIQIVGFYLLFRGACTLRDRYTVPTR
jgi:FlaA1/EpsC-like NDP-sugar epimerase